MLTTNRLGAKSKVYSFLISLVHKYGTLQEDGSYLVSKFPTLTDLAPSPMSIAPTSPAISILWRHRALFIARKNSSSSTTSKPSKRWLKKADRKNTDRKSAICVFSYVHLHQLPPFPTRETGDVFHSCLAGKGPAIGVLGESGAFFCADVGEVAFFHDALGLGVDIVAAAPKSVIIELGKSVGNERLTSFGNVAFSPMRHAEPIAELCLAKGERQIGGISGLQADAADWFSAFAQADGVVSGAAKTVRMISRLSSTL